MKRLFLAAMVASLTGCAAQMDDLRARDANESFVVKAPLECLYEKGVEHATGMLGMSEPRFTMFINQQAGNAWFRQPLTLVELKRVSADSTVVSRRQTGSAEAFGQANDLMDFFQKNPCKAS
jgi:hypothetical protein